MFDIPASARLTAVVISAFLRGYPIYPGYAIIHVSENQHHIAEQTLPGRLAGLYLMAMMGGSDSGQLVVPLPEMPMKDNLYVHLTVEGDLCVCQGMAVVHYQQ